MRKYIYKRLLAIIPVVICLTIIVFLIIHLVPGNPILLMFGYEPDPVQVEAIKELYGLDKPLYQQYFHWISNIIRFDWGKSIHLKEPVWGLIKERLPRTFVLCILGIGLSLLIAIPSGILSAVKHNTFTDLNITTFTLILISIPSFWLGIILVILFAVFIPIFPPGGYIPPEKGLWGSIVSITLPVVVIAAALAASTTRLLRSSLLEVLNEDYIMLARTKGNPNNRVLFIHALRNAFIPVFTTVSMQVAYLLGGEVVIERVFSFPGMGLLLISAIEKRDYPVIQGTILAFTLIVVFVNLITDVLYAAIDPRIKYD